MEKQTILRICTILFYTTIVLLRLPPFYVLPVRNPFFNSHSVARYILGFLFMVSVFLQAERPARKEKKILLLSICFLLSQALSLIFASDISAFLLSFKNILFAVALFVISLSLIKNKTVFLSIITILVATSVINTVIQFMIYFRPDYIFSLLKSSLYEAYWEGVELNIQRGRFFIDIYDSALIALVAFYYLQSRNLFKKTVLVVSLVIVSFLSFISNFRIHILMLVSSSGAFLWLGRFRWKQFFVIGLFITFILGNYVSTRLFGYGLLNRLTFQSEEDFYTVSSRVEWWKESLKMFAGSPIFGVGLGNYYDNLPAFQKIKSLSYFASKDELKTLTLNHPHNIFFGTLAETGIVGLFFFLILIIYFIHHDRGVLIKDAFDIKKVLIISFWSLFIFALFNPPVTLPYLSLFWLLRALIIKSSYV